MGWFIWCTVSFCLKYVNCSLYSLLFYLPISRHGSWNKRTENKSLELTKKIANLTAIQLFFRTLESTTHYHLEMGTVQFPWTWVSSPPGPTTPSIYPDASSWVTRGLRYHLSIKGKTIQVWRTSAGSVRFKRTVSVISIDIPWKNGISRFTTGPWKPLIKIVKDKIVSFLF